MTQVYEASRYDKGGGADYLNIPLDREQYVTLVNDLTVAEKHEPHGFETDAASGKVPFFEACLPVEEMARRGEDTLRFGPLKPVGLIDPRTGRRPYAVVQLRRENAEQRQQLVQAIAREASIRPATPPPPTEPGKYIARDQISFAGYLTPEAAAQSTMWSMLSGNYDAITNSFSSDMLRGVLKSPLADREAFEKSMPQLAAELRGIQILARKILADDKVELKMKIDSDPTDKPEITIHSMIKVGDQWKVAGRDRTYKPEWEQVGTIETFSP